MKKSFPKCEAGRISRSRRRELRGAVSVLSAILGIASEWPACAQTNVSIELREALDDPNLVWNTSGTGPWRLQFDESHDGADAAEGGPLQAGIIAEQNSITTSVLGPGTLSFWWRLEDAECFELSFQVGIDRLATIGPWTSESTNWVSQTVRIPSGSHNLTWRFQTFCGDGSPPGRAWLDEVKYTPAAPVLAVLSHNADSLSVEVIGPMGTTVQAEISTNLLSWAPLASPRVTLANGRGVLQVPKSDSKAFYRVVTVP